jgi:hypothetical protein
MGCTSVRVSLAVLFCSCTLPIDECAFLCENGACPSGLSCGSDNYCHAPGHALDECAGVVTNDADTTPPCAAANVGQSRMNQIFGASPSDIWAVGETNDVAFCSAPAECSAVAGDFSKGVSRVWASNPSDVWLAGEAGVFHCQSASTCTALQIGGAFTRASALGGSSAQNVWLASQTSAARCTEPSSCTIITATHLNAAINTVVVDDDGAWLLGSTGGLVRCSNLGVCDAPLLAEQTSASVWNEGWTPGSGVLWAAGGLGKVLRCPSDTGPCGAVYTAQSAPMLYSIWGASDNDVYAVGAGSIVHCVTGKCSESSDAQVLYSVRGGSGDDVWIAGDHVVERCAAGACNPLTLCASPTVFRSVWVGPPGHAWFAGDVGTILFLRR